MATKTISATFHGADSEFFRFTRDDVGHQQNVGVRGFRAQLDVLKPDDRIDMIFEMSSGSPPLYTLLDIRSRHK